MSTAIIYATGNGTTKKIAILIKSKLVNKDIDLINLKDVKTINLDNYNTIIIGGSVYAGKIQSKVKSFIKSNILTLLQKRIALFLTCMNKSQEKAEFNLAFPELLRNHSSYNSIVGGEFIFDKMNIFERFLVRKISGVKSSVSEIRYDEIENIVKAINK